MSARQRGVAVVMAMGVVALAAVAAAAMLASQSTWSRASSTALSPRNDITASSDRMSSALSSSIRVKPR